MRFIRFHLTSLQRSIIIITILIKKFRGALNKSWCIIISHLTKSHKSLLSCCLRMDPLCEFQEENASASHEHEHGSRTHTRTADFLIFTPLFPFVRNLAISNMLLGFMGCLSLDKRQSSGIWSFISLIKAFHKQFQCILKSNKCPLEQHYTTTTG